MIDALALSAFLSLAAVWLLWAYYIFCMSIIRAHLEGKMSLVTWVLAAPFVLFAVVLDILLNYTILAIITLDFPKKREWTFSQRLERLIRAGGWRQKLAVWVAAILDPYDPSGRHIKNDPPR